MVEFRHVVGDRLGLHARPVVRIVEAVRGRGAEVSVILGDRCAPGSDPMALLGLGAAAGDVLTVRVEGPEELAVAAALRDALP